MTTLSLSPYPAKHMERDRWIVAQRPERNKLDPTRPYAFFLEQERTASGEIAPVATIFLTNRECAWRCLMCDLWKNTLMTSVSVGDIPSQISYALARMQPAQEIKLYNSGSFFDPHAIPLADYAEIAQQTSQFERVIVESHPALIGDNCRRFQALLTGKLEVAMGLETVHPQVLQKLNKRMTLKSFAFAAEQMSKAGIDLRIFILVKPPFMHEDEALQWTNKSIDFAFDCGAAAISLIPTRAGNGALDRLADTGDFSMPPLATTEAAASYGLSRARGRVFVDLWNISQTGTCNFCHAARIERLQTMNLTQSLPEFSACTSCEARG